MDSVEGNSYIVYVAKFGGKVMYVGEGKPLRYLHLTSGISHCYEANKHHFLGNSLKVEVVREGLSKGEARKVESELILELQPQWNRVGLVNGDNKFSRMEVMKINRALIRSFKGIRQLDSKGLLLLRLLTNLVDRNGYVSLTGKQLKEKSKLEVTSKYVSHLVREAKYRQFDYMDDYVIVNKPDGLYNAATSYQLTQKVLDMVSN